MTRAWIGFVPLAFYVGMLAYGCTVTPSQHAANAAESAQAAAEYTQCRESAKLDGGWDAYQACACGVDKRHGVNTSTGCP
jgi:hypothetical protein